MLAARRPAVGDGTAVDRAADARALCVFVTVGSTRFQALVDAVLSRAFVDAVRVACAQQKRAHAELIVQYGQSIVKAVGEDSTLHGTSCVHTRDAAVDIYMFSYTRAFGDFLRRADVVVAHGGMSLCMSC